VCSPPPPTKRSPALVRKRRSTPRRRKAPRWTAKQWESASPRLLARARWSCERCGTALHEHTAERHHRQRREVGGDRFANIVVLCGLCHGWLHAHPAQARADGLIVEANGSTNPAAEPVRRWGYWWLLDDEGNAHPLP
jgi:hypothetical protein